MPFLESDGIRFHYVINGSRGPWVVFQHGLGGDVSQPQGILAGSAWLRTASFDCRGHGLTRPLGPLHRLTFSAFADDLRNLLDALGLDRVTVGGISMGAGVALNFALRHPERTRSLILSRPAWLDAGHPPNLDIFDTIARALPENGVEGTRQLLLKDPVFRRIEAVSREHAASILRQLERPDLAAVVATLTLLPADTPCPVPQGWRGVRVPTLVLVNAMDPLHPADYGQRLAAEIPGAQLVELTPKEKEPVRHALEMRDAIERFVGAP